MNKRVDANKTCALVIKHKIVMHEKGAVNALIEERASYEREMMKKQM